MKLKKIIDTCGFHCIKIKNLGVSFGEQVVLKDVNLHIHCGSLNAIIGKNGAGKSTLVRAILKDVPTEAQSFWLIFQCPLWQCSIMPSSLNTQVKTALRRMAF